MLVTVSFDAACLIISVPLPSDLALTSKKDEAEYLSHGVG